MKSILIIDGDRPFRGSLASWLADFGWDVREAAAPEAGMEMAREQKPEVVVLPLDLVRNDGSHVLKAFRSSGAVQPKTKIILTTSADSPADRLHALEWGADEYLVKPAARDAFLAVFGRLRPSETPAGAGAIPAAPAPKERATRVKFWGVRGSLPTPGPGTVFYGGNTSCVELRTGNEVIILDAGSGIRPLGNQLAAEFKGQPLKMTLLLTHTHWDHIQGFPFFAPAYNPNNELTVLSCEGGRRGLEATLAMQMESPFFPISMRQMPGHIFAHEIKEPSFEVGRVTVRSTPVNHPGICVGYRLETPEGSVAFIPDNELFQRLKAAGSSAPAEEYPPAEEFTRHQDHKLVEFLRGVDVLIHDSQYDETEYRMKVGWGHSCVDDTVALAVAAQAKTLYLFHHDPTHDDERVSRMVGRARGLARHLGGSLKVEGAREGTEAVIVEKPARSENA